MAELVVNSTTADGSARAASATYSTARAMTSPTAYTSEIGDPVGQQVSGGTYTCYQLFLDFDTSSIGAGATVTAVVLELYLRTDSSATDFTAQARIHDWGGTFEAGDVVAGADLSGKTLVATLASSGIGAVNAYKAFTDVAFTTNINQTGTTRIIVASDRQAGNNTPTTTEWMDFILADNGSNQPKLTVTYTPAASSTHHGFASSRGGWW